MRLSLVNSLQTPPGRHGLLIGENSWLSKCCFHLTLIFLTLIFVGFRPSKIHMALSLKTRNFNFGDPTTPRTPSCCWWVFWLGLLVVFWFRKNFKTLVILWFLFVYSPIKLSRRRIKFDQHFPITLHQAVHNARVSPSSLVASTTTLRLQ